ncbi:MAG: alpha/beta fold hydrolase [Chlamydiia bacterium]|nr:alpha/beta fold hydrolase [Chlamydiia bacterium]
MDRNKLPRSVCLKSKLFVSLITIFVLCAFTPETRSSPGWICGTKNYLSLIGNDVSGLYRCWKLKWKSVFVNYPVLPESLEGGTPVLFVHGYMHNNTAWIEFRKACEESGMGPIFTPSLRRSMDDIRASAFEIARWVRIIKKVTGKNEVILVGHSMGGIVSTYCAQHLAEPGSIKAVITLGSPLKGTHVASFAIGKAAFQMQKDSPFLTALMANVTENPKTRYICFGSRADEAVRPFESAFINDPHVVYDDIGHSSMLFHEGVIRDVLSMIQTLDQRARSDEPEVLVWFRKPFNQEGCCTARADAA